MGEKKNWQTNHLSCDKGSIAIHPGSRIFKADLRKIQTLLLLLLLLFLLKTLFWRVMAGGLASSCLGSIHYCCNSQASSVWRNPKPWSPMEVAGNQVFGLPSAISGTLAGSWIRNGGARTWTSTLKWEVGVPSSSTHCPSKACPTVTARNSWEYPVWSPQRQRNLRTPPHRARLKVWMAY